MIAVVAQDAADAVLARLDDAGESAWIIGSLTDGAREVTLR
jgi:phosphoribosylaminoimidazole (AIR) synthetase